MSAVVDWIRPWFPAGLVGHIFADCPDLLDEVSEPAEGAGWLDPFKGEVCNACLKRSDIPSWEAVCDTCDSSMKEEWAEEDGSPYTRADAELWKSEHRCEPYVRVISPNDARKKQ